MAKVRKGPLSGLRIVEMAGIGPAPFAAMLLADLGAEVIKVEPVDGDRTRRLRGFGAGFFGYFNRNKKSLALDVDVPEGRAALVKLLQSADVLIENFAPGSMSKRGLGPEHLEKINPRLVYCSLKGFLKGPYEKRPALDEVVQMMGGLAYMTGPSGRPLRAGTSVVDIVGGMFGAFATVLALKTSNVSPAVTVSNSSAMTRPSAFGSPYPSASLYFLSISSGNPNKTASGLAFVKIAVPA